MPRKKENNNAILPGLDIFGQALPENDQGVLLKPRYRRKHLAGFVPLWNEFFRCYHLAGVSVQAVYLWAYLRQYEHERREWNAISDISWPGRRDMAEALGVSISHLPNLLGELRQAGLVSFQLVLPGFEELASELNNSLEEVRERAADYGVNPKVDGTIYRTADPFTRTEFANATGLKFCKSCKIYRYCDGAKEARSRISNNSELTVSVNTTKTAKALPAVDLKRQVILNTVNETDRIQVETVTVSKKVQPANPSRIDERIDKKSDSVSKKVQPANPSRIKTNMYQTISVIQHDNSTMQFQQEKDLVVVNNQVDEQIISVSRQVKNKQSKTDQQANISQKPNNNDLKLLIQFGFDAQVATHLVQKALNNGKVPGYIQRIIRYAVDNARQNPQGMVRHLIERGEERLSKADRWQQQTLFDTSAPTEEQELTSSHIQNTGNSLIGVRNKPRSKSTGVYSPVSSGLTGVHSMSESELTGVSTAKDDISQGDWQAEIQHQLAAAYRLPDEALIWWRKVVAQLEYTGFQNAAELFRASIGLWKEPGKLLVILRSLFDKQRAVAYQSQLERAVAALTGQWPWIEFVN